MTGLFKKNYVAIIGMLIALTAQVNGMDHQPICCEPRCSDTCKLNFNVELLYWRPELCGLESVFGNTEIATTVDSNNITTTVVRESDKEPHFKWNTGFRVGADVAFDCFDLELEWTHFDGRAKFRENSQHGHWKIKYDVVDLTFGRRFCVVPCFYLQPFIGVRGIQIHQKLKSHLETIFTSSAGTTTVFTDKHDKEDFWGVGPQLGLNADWYLGCNLSLYGSFAVVTYYGDVKSKNCDTDTFTRTVSVCNGRKKHCFNDVGTDAAIGIRWDESSKCFSGCDVNFMVKLGLEQHRIYDFSNLGSDGTLSLDGGIFAVGITFDY